MAKSNAAEKLTDLVPIHANAKTVLSVAAVGEGVGPFGEPPWSPSGTLFRNWELFERYSNYLNALIVAGRLEADGVTTIVETASAFPGVFAASLWVPEELVHRARWVLAWPMPTDRELIFLATGELSPDVEKE